MSVLLFSSVMPQHTVQPGECLTSIADQFGFFWDTLWNHPANAGLRAQRADPNTLMPGDSVTIPDKRPKIETRVTDQHHKFHKKGIPAKLRLQILCDGEPLAGAPFTLTVDDRPNTGVTGPDGKIEVTIQANARTGRLVAGAGEQRVEYVLQLGYMPPIEETKGILARLKNLGFDCGNVEGELDPKAQLALKEFQTANGLEPTGQPDGATAALLRQMEGG